MIKTNESRKKKKKKNSYRDLDVPRSNLCGEDQIQSRRKHSKARLPSVLPPDLSSYGARHEKSVGFCL